MLPLLSKSLGQLAITLQLLSLALAAPATYEIAPPPPSKALETVCEDILIDHATNTIKSYVACKSKEYGVNTDLAVFLVHHESRFNPLAKNPSSTASGLFQWISASWRDFCEGDVFNPIDNTNCALRVISSDSRYGIRHWSADANIRHLLVKAGFIQCFEGKNNCEVLPEFR